CHTKEAQIEAYNALYEAFSSGRIPLSRLEDALTRINRLKQKSQKYPDIYWHKNWQLTLDTSLRAITQLKNNDLPLIPGKNKVKLFFPEISGLVQVEDILKSETLGPFLSEHGIENEETLYPLKPTAKEIEQFVSESKDFN